MKMCIKYLNLTKYNLTLLFKQTSLWLGYLNCLSLLLKNSKLLVLHCKVNKFVFLSIMLLFTFTGNAQGLLFKSNDSLQSQRTSYEVFKNDIPTFHDRLLIRFDLSLWDNEHLGYVLNINDSKNNSYSLSYIYSNQSSYLNFNIDSKSNKIKIPISLSQLKKGNWMNVMINIDLKKDKVGIFINGKWYRADHFGFENKITPEITFGRNKYYSDVPNMAIKNLSIRDDSKNYFFPLYEWEKNNVYNNTGENLGFVDNPVWLIKDSYFWKPLFFRKFNEVVGLNFDEKDQNIFIFKSDSLMLYDIEHDKIFIHAYQNKFTMPLILGKSIVNSKENKCYVYEVYQGFQKGPSIAALDLGTLKWDSYGKGTIKEQRHHHNIFYDINQNAFYLFGGYGAFSYFNNFFKYDKATDSWQKVKFIGDLITPRFFSGFSKADDKNEVYIFGGYGNQSGNQIVGGKHYYDLYKVNLTNHTIKKCWEIKPREEDFVSANNLILSGDKKYFYALCYPHEKPKTILQLYKFSIKDGSYEIVSGPIPVTSERIETDINLFFDLKMKEFFCTIQEFTNTIKSTIKIYSLSFPPVSQHDYLEMHKIRSSSTNIYIYLVLFLLSISAIAGLVLYFKGKKKSNDEEIEQQVIESAVPVLPSMNKKDEIKVNAIYLLGEFTVYDKNGKDITYLFSPKIENLFILLLLNSKDKGGVVSKKISTTLWPEKEIEKTKNIKGVTINHLRNIIADIDGIELACINDTYCFKFCENIFCDYLIIIDAIKEINSANKQADLSILDYFDLIARGGLMQNIPVLWLDDFKLAYEEALLLVILPQIKNVYTNGNFRKTLEISHIVLNIDPFNEEAIKYKIKAFKRIKGIEYARKIYEEFIIEYKRSLDVDYPIPFDKICSGNSDRH
jgi:two-component SAPR family response regulator